MKGQLQFLLVGLGMACRNFINPSPRPNFHAHRIVHLMKNNVQFRRHSHKFRASSNLSDLKQSAALRILKLLILKTPSRKPTLGYGNQL